MKHLSVLFAIPALAAAQDVIGIAPQASTFQFIAAEPGMLGKTVTGAPYSGEGFTEIVRTLADGTRIANKNSRKVWRDSQGRTREESSLPMIGPWAAEAGDIPKIVTIIDPVAKTITTLNERDKTAFRHKMPDFRAEFDRPRLDAGAVGGAAGSVAVWRTTEVREVTVTDTPGVRSPAPELTRARVAAAAFHAHGGKEEPIGAQVMEGLKVEGKRSTHTIKAGEIGNDRDLVTTSERWTSPELQTIVRSLSKDPQAGEIAYRLTNISRAEPAAALFQVPAGYTVTDAPTVRLDHKIEMKARP